MHDQMQALTGQTDRAHEADVDDPLMAETNSPEIDLVLRWQPQLVPEVRWRQENELSRKANL